MVFLQIFFLLQGALSQCHVLGNMLVTPNGGGGGIEVSVCFPLSERRLEYPIIIKAKHFYLYKSKGKYPSLKKPSGNKNIPKQVFKKGLKELKC